MILPLGDEPNPPGVPVVTYGLILANCLVFLLVTLPLSVSAPDPNDPLLGDYVRMIAETLPRGASLQDVVRRMSAYDLVVFRYGFRPAAPQAMDLLTAMFLHAGFMHLAGNMLFLWIYGDNVEHRLGRLAFLFWYLATGVLATVTHALFSLDSGLPLVGASGAISGVLGFYFLWFPHNRVRLFVFLFPIIMQQVRAPARLVLGFFVLIDNLLPFLISQGGGAGVAYGAHLGGFLGGLAAAWATERRQLVERPSEYRRPEPAQGAAAATRRAISEALAQGQYGRAAQWYFALPTDATRGVLSPSQSLALAGWLAHNGHARAALTVYQRQLRDHPVGEGAADAHAGAGLVQLQSLGQPTSAYQHFVDALDLDPSPETERVVREALRVIAARQKFRFGTR